MCLESASAISTSASAISIHVKVICGLSYDTSSPAWTPCPDLLLHPHFTLPIPAPLRPLVCDACPVPAFLGAFQHGAPLPRVLSPTILCLISSMSSQINAFIQHSFWRLTEFIEELLSCGMEVNTTDKNRALISGISDGSLCKRSVEEI